MALRSLNKTSGWGKSAAPEVAAETPSQSERSIIRATNIHVYEKQTLRKINIRTNPGKTYESDLVSSRNKKKDVVAVQRITKKSLSPLSSLQLPTTSQALAVNGKKTRLASEPLQRNAIV